MLEYKYLQFLSEITKDILSRNVTSDSELLVIMKSHVTANKQHLREVSMYVCMYVYNYIYIYICIYICIYIIISICMYVCMYVYMYVCMYVCMYASM